MKQLMKKEILSSGVVDTFKELSDKANSGFVATDLSRSYDSYPSVGYIHFGYKNSYTPSKLQAVGVFSDGKKAVVTFAADIDWSNALYHSKENEAARQKFVEGLTTLCKPVAAKYKAAGAKIVLDIPKDLKSSSDYKFSVQFLHSAAKSAAKWGIEVTSGDGKNRHVFTSTPNSIGPWKDEGEARSHVDDLLQHLEYDDDYKRPSARVVRASSKLNECASSELQEADQSKQKIRLDGSFFLQPERSIAFQTLRFDIRSKTGKVGVVTLRKHDGYHSIKVITLENEARGKGLGSKAIVALSSVLGKITSSIDGETSDAAKNMWERVPGVSKEKFDNKVGFVYAVER